MAGNRDDILSMLHGKLGLHKEIKLETVFNPFNDAPQIAFIVPKNLSMPTSSSSFSYGFSTGGQTSRDQVLGSGSYKNAPPAYSTLNPAFPEPSAPPLEKKCADALVEQLAKDLNTVKQTRSQAGYSADFPTTFENWQRKTEGNNEVITLSSSQSLMLIYHHKLPINTDKEFHEVFDKKLSDRCSIM